MTSDYLSSIFIEKNRKYPDMKKILYILLLTSIINFFTPFPSLGSTVKVDIIHSTDRYLAGSTYPIIFRLKIAKPYFIHAVTESDEYLIPTKLTFNNTPDMKITGITYPEPEKIRFDYISVNMDVYSGDILVRANLSTEKTVSAGERTIKGNLSYQACTTDSCLQPEDIPLEFPITLVTGDAETRELNGDLFLSASKIPEIPDNNVNRMNAGLFLTLLGIFMGGLALNLTPCVYPLIPITVSYFGGKSRKIGGRSMLHGTLYLAGLSITNSILGVFSALSGSLFGSILQNPLTLTLVACIITALALSFFGFWELRIPNILSKAASKNYSGYFGTFFMGLTLGVVAAPCIGPFILALLTKVAQQGDPFLGFLYFFVLSIGMGLPLCILAVFSGAIDRLPMSGDWMLWVRKLMGWVLIGMAVYMISPLFTHKLFKLLLLSGVGIVSGVHLGFLDKTGNRLFLFSLIKKISGIIIILVASTYFVLLSDHSDGIKWTPYNTSILSDASQEKRPVVFDIYADWCMPCRELDKTIFTDPEIVELSKKVIVMRLDLTKRHPSQDEILSQYKISGVPTIIFLNREGIEEKELRVTSIIEKEDFLYRMKKLLEK